MVMLPKSPPGLLADLRQCWGRSRRIYITDSAGLRIKFCQSVFACQSPNQTIHILCLWPNARHYEMSWRTVKCNTPGAIVGIIYPVIWHIINLWMLRGQLLIKRLNARMRRDSGNDAVAKLVVELASFIVGQPSACIPDC